MSPRLRCLPVALLLLVGAIGGHRELVAGGMIPLRVYGLPDSYSTSPYDVADLRVVEAFRQRHPDVALEPAAELMVEGLGQEIGPLMMIAGGLAPDVVYVSFRKIDSYVRQGILLPLDEYIAAETARDPTWKSNVVLPQIEQVVRRPDNAGQEHYYALPFRYKVMGVRFNRALFRQAGLPMRGPKDWEEMIQFARRINELDPRNKGLLLNIGLGSASWNLMNFLWSTGADAVQEVAANEWRAVFNTEAAVDAFEYYYRLVEGEKVAFRDHVSLYMRSPEARRVGMVFYYNVGDRMVNYDSNLWGYSAVPVGPLGIRGAELNAMMLGIFAGITDARVRDAAWEYIKFFSSEAAQRIRTDTLVEMGAADQVNPADLEKFGHASSLEMVPAGFREEFATALADSKPEPYGKNCNLVFVEMSYPLDRILLSPVIKAAWQREDRPQVRAEIKRILDGAVRATNERMLGVVPAGEMRTRRIVAWGLVLVVAGFFGWVGRAIVRSFSEIGRASTRASGRQIALAWGLLAVPLALAVMWSYLPLARGVYIALLDYQLMVSSVFVGIDNFANTLFDARFWGSMAATLHFAAWMLTAGFAAPIVLAYLLHLIPRHKLLFRTIYYIPAVLTGTAVFVLWKEFFGVHGLVNDIFGVFGLRVERPWPQDPRLAMLSCVLPGIWAGAGPGCLIYLAALKTIPEEQFEAAEIDGAGLWRKTVHIVLPSLGPLIIINFIGAVMAAFQASQNILIMTAGGPNGLTEVAALRIFFQAFMFLQFGPATAMAWILGSMLVGFAFLQLRQLSRMEFRAGR